MLEVSIPQCSRTKASTRPCERSQTVRLCRSTVRVAVDRLPLHVETTIYFLVSEALTNVVKHARATQAEVEIARRGAGVTVTVADDGIGDATIGADGSGLRSLVDRVAAADGQVRIESDSQTGRD